MATSQFFENIVETVREPLLVLDPQLRVVRGNGAFYRTFAVSQACTEGRPLHELGNGQWNIIPLRRQLERVLSENVALEDFEVTHSFESIGIRSMLLNARQIVASDAGPLMLLALEDVTERRAIEKERERLIAELTRSNQELERFAYVASHDLQEPLRMISSYTQLLARKYHDRLDDKANMYIHFAVDGAQRMQALINGLLSYSRIGKDANPFAPVDLNLVFGQVKRNLEMMVTECSATINSEELPTVNGDAQQLQQVFQNLLVNALKFKNASAPVVAVTAENGGDSWTIKVADNGIGIDPAYFEKLFVIFQRLHTRAEYPGHGLGLAITRRIVERHGGRIWVDSAAGEGSTFCFTLPKCEGTDE